MGVMDWFKRGNGEDARLRAWRAKWRAVVESGDDSDLDALARELDAFALPEDDVEIEREMLEGLERLATLTTIVERTGLPVVPTGHRVVGTDVCHFISPVSMPDEPTQPGGQLLLTNARAIFVGGTNGAAIPWHAVTTVSHAQRDLVLIRADQQKLYRFRCNTYADALEATYLARHLISSRRQPLSPHTRTE